MSEQDLVDLFVARFEQWFNIIPERYDDNRIGRIDLLLEDKITRVAFGVECKRPGGKKGREMGDIISQCCQYSRLQFEGKRIPVFLFPAISANQLAFVESREEINGKDYILDRHDRYHRHHAVNPILSHLNFGEIRKQFDDYHKEHYHDFIYNNTAIYSTRRAFRSQDIEGLKRENYTTMLRRINEWDQQSRIFKITKQ